MTGSRIASALTEGASPVTVIDAETIKIDGVRSVENLLNNLPQGLRIRAETCPTGRPVPQT